MATTSMSNTEALEWAMKFAKENALFELKTNQRGYTDGQIPVSPAERIELLRVLVNMVQHPPVSINECEHGFAVCAPCGYLPPPIRGKIAE